MNRPISPSVSPGSDRARPRQPFRRLWAIGIALIMLGLALVVWAVCALFMLPIGVHSFVDVHTRAPEPGQSGGAGQSLYSVVDYPLNMEVGNQSTVTLLLSTTGNIGTVTPTAGTGVLGPKPIIPLPANVWDYSRIVVTASVITPSGGAGPVIWQPIGETQVDLLAPSAPKTEAEDAAMTAKGIVNYYVDAVQFNWRVRALSDGGNTASIAIGMWGIARQTHGVVYFNESGQLSPKPEVIPIGVAPIAAIPSRSIWTAFASAGGGIVVLGILLQFGKVGEAVQNILGAGKSLVSSFRRTPQPAQRQTPGTSGAAIVAAAPEFTPAQPAAIVEVPPSTQSHEYTIDLLAMLGPLSTYTFTVNVHDEQGRPVQNETIHATLATSGMAREPVQVAVAPDASREPGVVHTHGMVPPGGAWKALLTIQPNSSTEPSTPGAD